MQREIFILSDYKDRFETKYTASPYRSGFDKELIANYFNKEGYVVIYKPFSAIDFRREDLIGKLVLYCSSEDLDGYYKSYIEDIILGLKLKGAVVIPDFIYLKAHHNKLFMEILRDLMGTDRMKNIHSRYFGTIEELKREQSEFAKGSYVIKPAMGAMSKGVSSGSSLSEVFSNAKKISKVPFCIESVKDSLRRFKHKGYIKDSNHRKRFIVQNMVKGLSGDWKVLIYDTKFYVLQRKNRKNDFRASGGGRLSYVRELPEGLLDFAQEVYRAYSVPNISLDIGFNGQDFFLIEFQSLYFGTYTIEKSEFYFTKESDAWTIHNERSILEEEYVKSVCKFISAKVLNE